MADQTGHGWGLYTALLDLEFDNEALSMAWPESFPGVQALRPRRCDSSRVIQGQTFPGTSLRVSK